MRKHWTSLRAKYRKFLYDQGFNLDTLDPKPESVKVSFLSFSHSRFTMQYTIEERWMFFKEAYQEYKETWTSESQTTQSAVDPADIENIRKKSNEFSLSECIRNVMSQRKMRQLSQKKMLRKSEISLLIDMPC